MTEPIKQLHKTWNEITGQQLNARATERLFFEFWKMDFTIADLKCVLNYILSYNRKHPAAPMKVQVHKVLGDLEVFASILGEARAKERNQIKPTTDRQAVLQAFRPVADQEGSATGNTHRIGEFIKVPII